MIAIIGHIDVDQAARDDLVASTADLQREVHDEPGCLAYTISADPTDQGRISIVELWESAETLQAHFVHPNIVAISDALRARPRLGSSTMKYRIDAAAPVRGDDGRASAAFPPTA